MEQRFNFTLSKDLPKGEVIRAFVKLDAYFSITGEICKTWRREPLVCGCIHEEIRKNFPELSKFIPWHLTSAEGIPMHYVENAVYWMEKVYGVSRWQARNYDPDPRDAFKATVVFGKVEYDEMPWLTTQNDEGECLLDELNREEFRNLVKGVVHTWCEGRLPSLQEAFHRDMNELSQLQVQPEQE